MLQIHSLALGPLETNCHIVFNDKQAVIVDPGGEPEVILNYLQSQGRQVTSILNTHLHFDHIQANAAVAAATGAVIWAGEEDGFMMDCELGAGGIWGFPKTPPFSWSPLKEGELVLLGETCQVLATPGHSPGSRSFYFPVSGVVLVGDLLFKRSVGRTDFPGGSAETLLASLVTKIFTLPEATVVYSGHGPTTTVGEEKRLNPYAGAAAGLRR